MKFLVLSALFFSACASSPKQDAARPSLQTNCNKETPQVCGDSAYEILNSKKADGRLDALIQLGNSCEAGYANACDWLGYNIEKEPSPEHSKDDIALPWYEKGCALKLASACNHASLILWSSPRVKPNQTKAIEYARLSCRYEPKVISNCRDYAQLLYYTRDEKSWQEAVKYLKDSCALKDQSSCLLLGIMYRQGMGTPKDEKSAYSLFSNACTARYFRGCSLVATVEKNAALQVKFCKEACDGDDPYGCNCLGHHLATGQGVEKNSALAAQYFERSCNFLCEEQNCDESRGQGCAFLAANYRDGLGVEKSNEKAVELLSKSCNMHFPGGCYDLAYHLEAGLGVKTDLDKAKSLYDETCAIGLAPACIHVAYLATYGPERFRDVKKAYRLLGPLCDKKDAMACNNLADLMEKEFFGKPDFVEVTKLYRRACEAGDTWGCSSLGILIHRNKALPVTNEDPLNWIKIGCVEKNEDACQELKTMCTETKYKDQTQCH